MRAAYLFRLLCKFQAAKQTGRSQRIDLSMKVFQLVGVRNSGKTTTAEILIGSLKARGYRVGTVKSIGCPCFTMDERRDSNTSRHRRAGADAVAALSKNETDFIYPRKLDLEDVLLTLSREGLDYCIVEGGYEYDLPRIVCFRNPEEIPERFTEKTFAFSGAGVHEAAGGAHALSSVPDFAAAGGKPCPALSALSDPGRLTDLLEHAVPDMILPVARIPRPESCRGFCRGCSGHERSRAEKNGVSERNEYSVIEPERGTSGYSQDTTEPLKD